MMCGWSNLCCLKAAASALPIVHGFLPFSLLVAFTTLPCSNSPVPSHLISRVSVGAIDWVSWTKTAQLRADGHRLRCFQWNQRGPTCFLFYVLRDCHLAQLIFLSSSLAASSGQPAAVICPALGLLWPEAYESSPVCHKASY